MGKVLIELRLEGDHQPDSSDHAPTPFLRRRGKATRVQEAHYYEREEGSQKVDSASELTNPPSRCKREGLISARFTSSNSARAKRVKPHTT